MTDRRDPILGELPVVDDDIAARPNAPRRDSTSLPGKRRRWRLALGIAIVLALAAFALNHWRGAIGARLVPPPQQNSVMQQADRALRLGRLTTPDGRGARELYQAVLARDPDDLAAREGLVRVGSAALAQAQAALRAHRDDEASRDLDLARDLAVPVADVRRVEQALSRETGHGTQIAALLAQADAAESAGHLDDGDASALAIYQQALSAAPDDEVVLARRRELLARMLGGIDGMLARNDVDAARHLIDRVASVDPGHLDLPAARARLAEVIGQRSRTLAHLLDGADVDLRAGRTDEAVAVYQQVLAQSPDELRAHAGLREAGEALIREANHSASDFNFTAAQAALAKAQALAPELPSLRAAEQHLQQARAMRAGMKDRPGMPGGNDHAKIDDLLAAADHAIVHDQLVEPPGDSAFDKLHAASAIAPGDPRVIAANRHFVATVVACADREMTDNHLSRANACLDALMTVQPMYASLPSMRMALARHWLAYADERIGAGELDNAQHAIASARQLTPDDPAIAALQTRVQQARAGGRH